MDTTSYLILSGLGTTNAPLVLDYNPANNSLVQNSFNPNGDQYWNIIEIPYTPYIFLRQTSTGFFACFSGGQDTAIMLSPLQTLNPAFTLQMQSVGNGMVAINNANASLVFNVQGATPTTGTPIIAWPWGSGSANAQWMFVPNGLI